MLFEIKKIHSPINRIIIILSCNYESVSSLTRKYIFIARSDLDSCLNGIRNDLLVVVGHESNFALITYRAHFHPLISTAGDIGDGLISLINVTLGLAFVEGIGAEQVSSS